jgi:threonine synthase
MADDSPGNSLAPALSEPSAAKVGADVRLLDGAAGSVPEIGNQRTVAADITRPLEDRLEAFEDVIESEVGDTTLTRARNVERDIGLRQLYLKFEGGNPSGTQKDRIAFAQVMDALRRGFDTVTAATCGNYGVALSFAASVAGLRTLIYIPSSYEARREKEILTHGAEVLRSGIDYESAVLESRERAARDELYDANPGGANTPIQLRAYGEIAYEIYDELRDAPAAVAVPVSNGTTVAGIYKGFVSLYRRGRTSHLPRIVVGSSFNKNPIVRAFLGNLPRCEDLRPDRVRESRINEPLVNWHSIDGDLALQAVRNSRGWADDASDKSMARLSRLLREREGLDVLPASTAGLVALAHRHAEAPLSPDRYVVVLTGRRT